MMTQHYCEKSKDDPLHRSYHDEEYGFPIKTDDALFERLILEINQAGLSWTTILKKKNNFRLAYDSFEIAKIAQYDEIQRNRLLKDKGIIRNRLKINAAIHNARSIVIICESFGSFFNWLNSQGTISLQQWVDLFRDNFKFTGPEIVREFLVSTGYLPGAHHKKCPIYHTVKSLNPPWMREQFK